MSQIFHNKNITLQPMETVLLKDCVNIKTYWLFVMYLLVIAFTTNEASAKLNAT